jgi:hypothetical protein
VSSPAGVRGESFREAPVTTGRRVRFGGQFKYKTMVFEDLKRGHTLTQIMLSLVSGIVLSLVDQKGIT